MRGLMQRAVSLIAQLAALSSCACEASAPASPRREGARQPATEWLGVREASPPAPAPPDEGRFGEGTWVLHVGDSFVDASFQQNLAPHFKASGAQFVADARTSTYTTSWAYGPGLDRWLYRKPSLVIVTLGANECDIPSPGEHARAVERISHRIAATGASCVWTAPPMWKHDTGIVQVIHDHCAPCLFFDSDAVLGGLAPNERREGIHPNARGGARWAEAFWGWLLDHRDRGRAGWSLQTFELRR
jgi:hypothetical protein